jgi:glycosyltransferase involved in cell wall biosynthesis
VPDHPSVLENLSVKSGSPTLESGATNQAPCAPVLTRVFDGVICFGGEDWWCHNRGHYDMQMMRRLAQRTPVLYINSIGMRTPKLSEGSMFLTRVRRKLKSLRRGMVRVEPGFTVYSPVAGPGKIGKILNPALLPMQIKRAARKLGIRKPLVWVACPPGGEVAHQLGAVGVVYQRTDRYEEFKDVDRALIAQYDRSLKADADVTVFCSTLLYEQEGPDCQRALYADHGVDYDRFALAGMNKSDEPEDVRDIVRPRVGFIGGIDSHTFDPAFFVSVAKELSDVQFVLVGACSLPDGWCELANVSLLGKKPYEEVARYMASCDVLIMPWNRNEWIAACNPVKLKEYLAVGRPVVTTPFYELKRYEGLVRITDEPGAFAQHIRTALSEEVDARSMRARVEQETWEAKAEMVLDELAKLGLRLN